ncbi:PepSY domain-containing protein [Simplicispira psychrophila]|uniref:PepSY domain-containing protein n=1 Tax=Simplicispira psychrophila TaxID=80882 RepID=UPI0004851D60|nr:PepSY domain-containing protein [Simplicispira psychrophila]
MNHLPCLRRGLLALSLGLATLPTFADDDCKAPMEHWQSREAVRQMAAREGWQIQRLKIDDGCYEIRGTDAQGRAFKAKIDPETLKVLKMKQRDRERSKERDRDRDREHAAPQPPSGAAAPAPLFTPGTAPRGQVE